MHNIKDLLNKFKNLILDDSFKKEAIINIIKEVVKIEVNCDDISIRNNIIYLNIRPIFKNEIFLKKEKILAKLKESADNKIIDINF